jgi:hypothetical protein
VPAEQERIDLLEYLVHEPAGVLVEVRTTQPPRLNPPPRSSPGPPGLCITPSTERNVVTVSFVALSFQIVLGS